MDFFAPLHFLIVLAVCFVPYFVPSIVAFSRNKINRIAILMLNLFLGWTVIGWVIALVWACKPDVVLVQQAPPAVPR